MTITLKHEAQCRDCGAVLPVGTKARWFRNGDIYGNACHRWQITGLSARRQKALETAALAVLAAAKGPQGIPEAAEARLATLKAACEQQASKQTFEFLIAELRSIEEQLRTCQ